jgi:hypothetical protein
VLKNAELKLDRADKHILDLEREFRAFIDGNAHSIIVEVNQDEGTVSIDAHFNSDPNKKFSPIIGDAVHNIACAMDHIAWEVIGVCGTRSKWTQFPRGRTAQEYESRCNAFVASEDAKDFFRRIGAYEGGSGEVIWAVSDCDQVDKHMSLTPLVTAASVTFRNWRVYNSSMMFVSRDVYTVDTFPTATGVCAIVGGRGVRIEFDDHPQITPTIFFGDSTNPFFFGKPIMPMLTTASARLRGVVDDARVFLAIRRP